MPEKGPFGEQIYPSYHHHLHNQMLNGTASNGFFRGGADSQQTNSAHFSSNNSLHFPSAFVAFHNSQMAAAGQRPTHENNFNPSASFHYPHGYVMLFENILIRRKYEMIRCH